MVPPTGKQRHSLKEPRKRYTIIHAAQDLRVQGSDFDSGKEIEHGKHNKMGEGLHPDFDLGAGREQDGFAGFL
jgi:hypothetical protein